MTASHLAPSSMSLLQGAQEHTSRSPEREEAAESHHSASGAGETRITLTTTASAMILARQMVNLEQLIKSAARDRRWAAAAELEETRERITYTRMDLLRREWLERMSA
jgi:hypothetical protein